MGCFKLLEGIFFVVVSFSVPTTTFSAGWAARPAPEGYVHARPCVRVALHVHVSVHVENSTASDCPTRGEGVGGAEPN